MFSRPRITGCRMRHRHHPLPHQPIVPRPASQPRSRPPLFYRLPTSWQRSRLQPLPPAEAHPRLLPAVNSNSTSLRLMPSRRENSSLAYCSIHAPEGNRTNRTKHGRSSQSWTVRTLIRPLSGPCRFRLPWPTLSLCERPLLRQHSVRAAGFYRALHALLGDSIGARSSRVAARVTLDFPARRPDPHTFTHPWRLRGSSRHPTTPASRHHAQTRTP